MIETRRDLELQKRSCSADDVEGVSVVMKLHSNYKFMLASFLLAASTIAVSQDSCEKLAGAKIPGATISLAQTVARSAWIVSWWGSGITRTN